MIVADTLGIFLPEVGRWARNLNKILNAALANMNENSTKQQKTFSEDTSERSRSEERSGPQYRHDFKPQADLLGGLTTQKALEVLGLKQGASLTEVKKAAHKLYLKHHPDKGGNAAEFERVHEADRFLREKLKDEQPNSWNFSGNNQTIRVAIMK